MPEMKTAEFLCVDDLGNGYTVIEYTEYVPLPSTSTAMDGIPCIKRYTTDHGELCNRLNMTTFLIFGANEVTVKIIPNGTEFYV